MGEKITINMSEGGDDITFILNENARGPAGSDAEVTPANVRAAVPNMVEVASPVNDDMIQRVGGSWVTRTIAQVRTALGLGSAAYTASTDYATAAQGILADSAIQEEDLAAVATSGNYSDLSGTPDLSNLQDQPLVVAVSQPAFNGAVYHNVASATYTDPSPVEGKGFDVLVINGTATVGGTGYGTAGTLIKRRWHSGAWQTNYVYLNKAQMDSLYLSNAAAGKTTPVDADSVGIVDSAASNAPKLLTFANLWVWIQSKFSGASSKTTPIDADSFNIVDSADSNAAKRVTGTNLKAFLKTYFDTLYGLLGGNNTWSGTNAFSSTTRPISSGTGTPASNSLITRTDGDLRFLASPDVCIDGDIRYQDGVSRVWEEKAITGSGSTAVSSFQIEVRTGSTTGSKAYRGMGTGISHLFGSDSSTEFGIIFDANWVFSLRAMILNAATNTDGYIVFGLAGSNTSTAQPSTKSFGLRIHDGLVYGFVHDGSTYTESSSILNLVGGSFNIYKYSFVKDGSSLKFYISNVLQATLTAPTGSTGANTGTIGAWVDNETSTNDFLIFIQGQIKFANIY